MLLVINVANLFTYMYTGRPQCANKARLQSSRLISIYFISNRKLVISALFLYLFIIYRKLNKIILYNCEAKARGLNGLWSADFVIGKKT